MTERTLEEIISYVIYATITIPSAYCLYYLTKTIKNDISKDIYRQNNYQKSNENEEKRG